MNFNSNSKHLEMGVSRLLNKVSDEKQKDYDNARLKAVEKAAQTSPVFIPLSFNLLAAGQVSPFEAITPALSYDVLIVGFICDNTSREIVFRETTKDILYNYVGDNKNLKLTVSDVSGGNNLASKGQKTPFYLPIPFLIRKQDRISLDVYKQDITANDETLDIVLIGYRAARNPSLSQEDSANVKEFIRTRKEPKTVFLKQSVNFDTAAVGGKAEFSMPQVSEPLLIRGFRSTLQASEIKIKIEGQQDWTVSAIPIFGLCAGDENENDNYFWLQRPVFLPSNQVIDVDLTNSYNGSTLDAQNGNTITAIAQTV